MVMSTRALHLALGWITAPNSVTLFTLMALFFSVVLVAFINRMKFVRRVNNIPGLPGGITILGNASTFLVPPEGKICLIGGLIQIFWTLHSMNCICQCYRNPQPFDWLCSCLEIFGSSSTLLGWTISIFFLIYCWIIWGKITCEQLNKHISFYLHQIFDCHLINLFIFFWKCVLIWIILSRLYWAAVSWLIKAATTIISNHGWIQVYSQAQVIYWSNTCKICTIHKCKSKRKYVDTKSGSKWFSRRKLLTPTFHFQILEDFVQVFNEQSQILIEQLHDALKVENELDIYPFITRCTLDIICGQFMLIIKDMRIFLFFLNQ